MGHSAPSRNRKARFAGKRPVTEDEGARFHLIGSGVMKSACAMRCCALLLWSMSSVAQQHPTCAGPQLGTWALLSMETEDLETGQKHNLLGAHPSGSLSYGPDCRMSAILVKESRKGPAALVATDPESIELYRGLIAYAGSYSIDGYKITHHIEASWNQAWTGATQVSQFNIDGRSLYIRTGPSKSPMTGRQSSTVFIWTRVE
jgi:Lipocalin-like domain